MALFGGSRPRVADSTKWRMAGNGLIDTGDSFDKPKRYFQGGDEFTARDAGAAFLSTLADAMALNRGYKPGAMESLSDNRNVALEMAKMAQVRRAEMDAARQRAVAMGFTNPQADAVAHGDIKASDIYQKPTAEMQNFGAWQRMDPAERAQYGQFRDTFDPVITNGYGSTVIPRSGIQDALGQQAGPQPGTIEDGYRFKGGNPADPNAWEPIGGPTLPASGGFR